MAIMKSIPVIADVDVIIVGGASGGVAAAAAAARAGAKVFLAATESYLGEDICATGQLWLDTETPLDTRLARDLFTDAAGKRIAPVRPMDIKRRLDTELIEAGVQFLFGCAPADLLTGADGRVAGVVLACKAGLFAVTGRAAIDATPNALLARAAGMPFSPWSGGDVMFRRVVVGHRAEGDPGDHGRLLPGLVRGEHGGKMVELEAFEYAVPLPVREWSPDALAEAEQTVRDRTWNKDQTWCSDRLWYVPPVTVDTGRQHARSGDGTFPAEAFATSMERLFVLGPCAAVTRADAATLLLAPHAIAGGEQLGAHAASLAAGVSAAPSPRPLRRRGGDKSVREPCTCARFIRERTRAIAGPAGADLPVLGEFDVVVAGGGTGGAPAAIAAARSGGRALVLETLHGLGGVGTLGCISSYYYGYRGGFTEEVTQGLRAMAGNAAFNSAHWNAEHKAEWFRREIRRAGGRIWYGSLVSGAVMSGKRVCGVVVNTPYGRGIVRAGAVIDATGNADVAAAAGSACRTMSDSDLAAQGSGLPPRPFSPVTLNTDYTFIEDSDPVDTTRAFIVARRKFKEAFDLAQICDTRERRQIVGDVTVSPLDLYTGRTWRDTICLSRSNFDSHGFTVHPLFLVQPPDSADLDAWLPLRALLPRGLDGLLVTGLALSGHRDVMPVLRMQADIQNHAYAAGLAAAAAARVGDGNIRGLDVKALQRRLADKGIIPQEVLLHRDRPRLGGEVVKMAIAGELQAHSELAAAMLRPDAAIPALRARLAVEPDGARRTACAKLLAVLGDTSGEAALIETVASADWDTGWNYTGMGQFGRSLSPLDDCIVCLGLLRSTAARDAVLAKAGSLDAGQAFSHFRAVALYAEAVGDASFATVLAGVLGKPGIAGHAWTRLADELADIPASRTDTRTRNEALRELYVARALFRCGDHDGVAARTLAAYQRDLRGHFARHAAAVLRSKVAPHTAMQ